MQDALLMIEDLLVVAGVLGFERAANELLDEARELVSFWPVELTGFERLVDARSQQVSGFAWFFWASVEEAALAAQMMDASPPALLPEATLVGAVLPTPEIFGWVLSRLEQMKQSLSAPPLASVQRVALARCAALGDGEGPEFDARVEGSCPAGAALSVFIVDRDHRHGERMIEGEDYQRRGEAWMLEGWRLSGWEDDALVVAVVSSEPLDGDNLEQVLDAAMAREDVIVTEAWLRPASTRRP